MTFYQCTGCRNIVKKSLLWDGVPPASFYYGMCKHGCGFVYHMKLPLFKSLRYKLFGTTPSLKWAYRQASYPKTDRGYGWNDR